MPYLIALAIIIVAGISFTLFRSDDVTSTTTPVEQEITKDVTNEETVTTSAPATTTDTPVTNNNTESVTPANTPPVSTKSETPAPAPTKVASDYVDGTYTSKITYKVPDHRNYTMDVTVTIDNDKITTSNIVYSDNALEDSNTKKFDNAYSSQVIDKDIDSINLSRIGGASLTTKAFNDAIDAVKVDAKS